MKCLLMPNSKILFIWNFLIMFCVGYIVTFMPYYMVFDKKNSSRDIIEILLNLVFIADMVLMFFSAFYDSKGKLVISHKEICISYLKGYFFIDLLTSIPFSFIMTSENSSNTENVNKILSLLKLPKLIRMIKLAKIIKVKEAMKGTKIGYYFRINRGFFKVLGLGLVTLIILHLGTCLWCSLGFLNNQYPNTWIFRYEMLDESEYNIYITAFYFCFTVLTTVGYGDITGFTNSKCIFWK